MKQFHITPYILIATSNMAIKFLFCVALVSTIVIVSNANLVIDYYYDTCPGAEDLVREEMEAIKIEDASLMPALLRLHFHDCFVRVKYI